MVQRVRSRRSLIVVPVQPSRDPRQRRVKVLWVRACGGNVFIDPAGQRFAVFPEHVEPPSSLRRRGDAQFVEEIPPEWKKSG